MIIIEWINLIKYQMLAKNSDIIATLRWVRLVHKCQIVKYWKQIESMRAFVRECAWRYAPASDALFIKHKYAQDDSNCIFANIWYLILSILSIIMILRIFMFYIQRVLADFWGRKDSAVGINKLFIAHFICWNNMHRCACYWHKSRCLFDLKSLPRRAVYKT